MKEIEFPACRSLQTADSSPHESAEQEKQHNAEERRQGMGMERVEEGRKGRPDDLVYGRLDRTADKRAADSGREQIMEDEDGASHLSETLSLLIVLFPLVPWMRLVLLCFYYCCAVSENKSLPGIHNHKQ